MADLEKKINKALRRHRSTKNKREVWLKEGGRGDCVRYVGPGRQRCVWCGDAADSFVYVGPRDYEYNGKPLVGGDICEHCYENSLRRLLPTALVKSAPMGGKKRRGRTGGGWNWHRTTSDAFYTKRPFDVWAISDNDVVAYAPFGKLWVIIVRDHNLNYDVVVKNDGGYTTSKYGPERSLAAAKETAETMMGMP
jgi:hypothetical protein